MKRAYFLVALAALAQLVSSGARAGRPLAVDDAAVNDRGAGHVEAWWARAADRDDVWSLSPAFAPWDGVELAGAVVRSRRQGTRATSLQVKSLWRALDDNACGWASVVGASSVPRGDEEPGRRVAPYLTAITSCAAAGGTVHLNAGLSRPAPGPWLRAASAAYERSESSWTWHLEWVAQQGSKPLVGVGARTLVAPNVQLDGTVSGQGGKTLLSLGTKFTY